MTSLFRKSDLLSLIQSVLIVMVDGVIQTYTQSKQYLDKNQSSQFCQSGVKQTHVKIMEKKWKRFFDNSSTLRTCLADFSWAVSVL